MTNDGGWKSEISVLTRLSAELSGFNGRHVEDIVPDSSQHLEAPSCLGLHASGGGDFARALKPQIYVHRRAASNRALPPRHRWASTLPPGPECVSVTIRAALNPFRHTITLGSGSEL